MERNIDFRLTFVFRKNETIKGIKVCIVIIPGPTLSLHV